MQHTASQTRTYIGGRDAEGRALEFSVVNGKFERPDPSGTIEDLTGATILPGFVDAHCHIIPMGLDMQKLHLGTCINREQVVEAVRGWAKDHPDGWLLAVHYDQTKFDDARHLTRFELDAVAPDRPVLLRHSNGHASIANTKALELAGIEPGTVDPIGGTFVRDDTGVLTGVLLERAHERVSSAAPEPTLQEMTDAVVRAGSRMSELGITCASDMMTGRWNLERELLAYHEASQGGCPIRLRLYAQWGTVFGPRAIPRSRLAEIVQAMDSDRCRLAGTKIFADGAIGSATAAISGAFLTTGGNGQLIYTPERFHEMVDRADKEGWSVAVHSIGDRSTDLVMDAFSRTQDPKRHRIEHAMMLSDPQVARLAALRCRVTMQPEFLLRFGHSYMKQLGPERAASLKRCRSLLDAGAPLSFSSDRPIVPGDPWDGINAAVDRPSGFDAAENVTMLEALRLTTRDAAEANGDAGSMGAIEPGRLADFQVFDGIPSKESLRSVHCSGVAVFTPQPGGEKEASRSTS